MKDQTELSIVILCYRSEESIIDFAFKVKKLAQNLSTSFEIILVGNYINGSNDRTKEIVEEIVVKDDTFKCVCKPKKGMMGWDMKEGLLLTKGKYICVIDGDGQFPIDSISDCFNIIKMNSYGLVKTYRRKRDDGFYRKFISTGYNLFFSILFPSVNSKDVNSKPKIFTREVYDQMNLTSDDWFIDAEIMLNINKMGVKFFEIPTEFYQLQGRPSFVKFSAILEFIKNLIDAKFNKRQ